MSVIKDALVELDPKNDDHWTEDGLPSVEAVQAYIEDETVTREQITEADPELTRQSVLADLEADEDEDNETSAPAKTGYEGLVEKHAEASAEVNRLRVIADRANEELRQAQVLADNLHNLVERNKPHTSNQDNLRAYLKTQQQLREQKAERARELQQLGLNRSDLTPISEIDQAMARKKGHGGGRPVVPPLRKD